MILTEENYYSDIANREYLSVSQYKQFAKCEAAAMAQINGEWRPVKSTALLVGSYVDAWFEGTLESFKWANPEIFTKSGRLRAEFEQAEEIIAFLQEDGLFMEYMGGKKQIIRTGELFGAQWKIKIDSLLPGKIVDLKVMRSMERIMGKSFVEHWGYDLQMAVYAAIEGHDLETYLAVVTKQSPPDKEIIEIPKWRREELLYEVQRAIPRILELKSGVAEPVRCGVCDYCRATKKLEKPIDFELVGLSSEERRAIFGSYT